MLFNKKSRIKPPGKTPSQPQRDPSGLNLFLIISVASILSSLILSRYFDQNSEKIKKSVEELKAQSVHLKPKILNFKSRGLQEFDPNAQFLSDSLLSIIQSYYVDPERVRSDNLIGTLTEVLNLHGASSGLIRAKSYAIQECPESRPNSIVSRFGSEIALDVTISSEQYIFCLPQKASHQVVADLYVMLAQYIEEKGIPLHAFHQNESADKNPTALVNLYSSTLSSLDAHSSLLSPEAYRELRQGTEGSFGGLGVLVGIRDHLLTVIKPLPKSPAQRSGIKSSDRIIGINGKFTFGFTLDQLVEYMRGEPGTSVNLSLLRKDSATPIKIHLKREIIQVDSISTEEYLSPGSAILRINIENFASRTSREVINAIKDFRKRHSGNVDGLILDLRANPGGLLDQAVQVADLFLPSGTIVSTRGRREEVEKADTGIDELAFPIVTLIDGESASASEIVAGALQDHGRAVIVGQPSFGKGSVQTIFELPQERALKITIARYYTPSGRSIQNVGIIPDIWLQPLIPKEENTNLLGSYRYKNEGFLKNHLEVPGDDTALSVKVPAIKGYYIAENSINAEEEFETGKVDHERDIALIILRKVKSFYKDKMPDFAFRSAHWLGLSGPYTSRFCQELNQKASKWLKATHNVVWNSPDEASTRDGKDLKLRLSFNDNTFNMRHFAALGNTYKIPFEISNSGSKKADRISIFVRSEHPQFETKEILIGSLGAGLTHSGHIEIKIPNSWEPGILPLRVGLALDSWPLSQATSEHTINIQDKTMAQINLEAKLTSERGGRVALVLESGEEGEIEVTLKNPTSVAAENVRVRLVNLSGLQSKLKHDEITVPKIPAGQRVKVNFRLEASQIILNESLDFGVQIESESLKQSVKKHFAIKSLPNKEISANRSFNLGH